MNKRFRFTDAHLKKLQVPTKAMALWYDTEVLGLCFRITREGTRSFCLRYRTPAGRERYWTIGRFSMTSIPDWTTSAARDKAAKLKDGVRLGRDPQAEAKELREAPLVSELAARFIKEHLSKRKAGTRYDYECILKHSDLTALKRKTVEEVSRKDIADLHHKVSLRSSARANTVIAVLSSMFSCAMRWELRGDNPCQHVKQNSNPERDRVLTDKELAEVWRAAGSAIAPFGLIVRMLTLTGQRREEVAGMSWQEIGDDLAVWTIPGKRTKNGQTNIVPLSQPAQQQICGNSFLKITRRPSERLLN